MFKSIEITYDDGTVHVISGEFIEMCWEELGSPVVDSHKAVEDLLNYVVDRFEQMKIRRG